MRVQQSRLLCSQTQFDSERGTVRLSSRGPAGPWATIPTARATAKFSVVVIGWIGVRLETVTCAIHAAVILARCAFQPYVGAIRYGTLSMAQAKKSSDLTLFWPRSIRSALSIKSL